eukprot:2623845-Lingulodinium_polyedra.AAC.1
MVVSAATATVASAAMPRRVSPTPWRPCMAAERRPTCAQPCRQSPSRVHRFGWWLVESLPA